MRTAPSTMDGEFKLLAGQRVFIVLPTFDMGGAERQALHLATYLQDRCQAAVAVVALFGGLGNQMLREMCIRRRLPCLRVSMPEHANSTPTFRSVRQFAREMRLLRPDVLLPYTSLPNLLCGATWRLAGAKVCLWSQRDEGRELPHERWQVAAINNTRCFISNSRVGAACLIEPFGIPAECVHLIINGVALEPAEETRAALRQRLAIAPGAPVGVMVANIHRYKDHATLVQAWQLVCRQQAAAAPTLLLAGREVETGPLKALVRELGLEAQVHFLGQVRDVAGLLGAADVAVFSSENEGTPNAVLEAMAAGLPVVATDIPGTRDALGAHYPYLIPPKSPVAFAQSILTLLRDEDLRIQVGRTLRQRVRQEFAVEQMCRRTCAVVEQELRRAAGPDAER